ncbi:MAG: low temperature requirement protein A [Flavobacteriales bacterium]|nr:low temperature requirement protein A [Flavobacteriales bacterium]
MYGRSGFAYIGPALIMSGPIHPPSWWGAPRDFRQRPQERKIGWLELFYDLVYVAVIGQLTHHLAAHPTWATLGHALLLFCMTFWSWVNGSQYYDLHGNDGLRTRLMTFWQMLAVAAVAITVQDAFAGEPRGLAIAFCVLQFLITYMWWSVGLYDPSHRAFNIFYTVNYLIALALLLTSVFVSGQVIIWLWTAALVLDLTPPLIGARRIVRGVRADGREFTASTSIVERFGLFTIIVLAESILAAVAGIAAIPHKHPVAWIAFVLAILIAFLLWSLYFDMTSEQETRTGYGYMQWLMFLHFPLLASFSIAGACLKVVLTSAQGPVPETVAWMFCLSLAVVLLMIVGLTRIMKEEEEDRSYIRPVSRLLVLMAVMLILLPLAGIGHNALLLLGIVAIVLVVPVVVGIRSWVRYKFPRTSGQE